MNILRFFNLRTEQEYQRLLKENEALQNQLKNKNLQLHNINKLVDDYKVSNNKYVVSYVVALTDRDELVDYLISIRDNLDSKISVIEFKENSKREFDEQKRLSLYPDKETRIYMEEQGKLFDKALPNLIENFGGKYIHFENGSVLDWDEDRKCLTRRVLSKNLEKQVFIKKVPT